MDRKDSLKRLTLRISSVVLPFSLVCIIVALTLAMLGDVHFPRFTISIFALVCSAFLWCAAVLLRTRFRFFFAATLLGLSGILLLLFDIGVVDLLLPEIWPFFMLFIGFSFMISGSLRYRRLHAVYIVPAIAFAGLGFVFLLFSTDVIPFSIVSLALWWIPLLALPSVFSFVIWLSRKRYNRDGDE